MKELASEDSAALKKAGLTDDEILEMKTNGKTPDGYQVHHKQPIEWGGTNSHSNLILIENDPYHLAFNSAMGWIADRKVPPGTTIQIPVPIPSGKVYVPPDLN